MADWEDTYFGCNWEDNMNEIKMFSLDDPDEDEVQPTILPSLQLTSTSDLKSNATHDQDQNELKDHKIHDGRVNHTATALPMDLRLNENIITSHTNKQTDVEVKNLLDSFFQEPRNGPQSNEAPQHISEKEVIPLEQIPRHAHAPSNWPYSKTHIPYMDNRQQRNMQQKEEIGVNIQNLNELSGDLPVSEKLASHQAVNNQSEIQPARQPILYHQTIPLLFEMGTANEEIPGLCEPSFPHRKNNMHRMNLTSGSKQQVPTETKVSIQPSILPLLHAKRELLPPVGDDGLSMSHQKIFQQEVYGNSRASPMVPHFKQQQVPHLIQMQRKDILVRKPPETNCLDRPGHSHSKIEGIPLSKQVPHTLTGSHPEIPARHMSTVHNHERQGALPVSSNFHSTPDGFLPNFTGPEAIPASALSKTRIAEIQGHKFHPAHHNEMNQMKPASISSHHARNVTVPGNTDRPGVQSQNICVDRDFERQRRESDTTRNYQCNEMLPLSPSSNITNKRDFGNFSMEIGIPAHKIGVAPDAERLGQQSQTDHDDENQQMLPVSGDYHPAGGEALPIYTDSLGMETRAMGVARKMERPGRQFETGCKNQVRMIPAARELDASNEILLTSPASYQARSTRDLSHSLGTGMERNDPSPYMIRLRTESVASPDLLENYKSQTEIRPAAEALEEYRIVWSFFKYCNVVLSSTIPNLPFENGNDIREYQANLLKTLKAEKIKWGDAIKYIVHYIISMFPEYKGLRSLWATFSMNCENSNYRKMVLKEERSPGRRKMSHEEIKRVKQPEIPHNRAYSTEDEALDLTMQNQKGTSRVQSISGENIIQRSQVNLSTDSGKFENILTKPYQGIVPCTSHLSGTTEALEIFPLKSAPVKPSERNVGPGHLERHPETEIRRFHGIRGDQDGRAYKIEMIPRKMEENAKDSFSSHTRYGSTHHFQMKKIQTKRLPETDHNNNASLIFPYKASKRAWVSSLSKAEEDYVSVNEMAAAKNSIHTSFQNTRKEKKQRINSTVTAKATALQDSAKNGMKGSPSHGTSQRVEPVVTGTLDSVVDLQHEENLLHAMGSNEKDDLWEEEECASFLQQEIFIATFKEKCKKFSLKDSLSKEVINLIFNATEELVRSFLQELRDAAVVQRKATLFEIEYGQDTEDSLANIREMLNEEDRRLKESAGTRFHEINVAKSYSVIEAHKSEEQPGGTEGDISGGERLQKQVLDEAESALKKKKIASMRRIAKSGISTVHSAISCEKESCNKLSFPEIHVESKIANDVEGPQNIVRMEWWGLPGGIKGGRLTMAHCLFVLESQLHTRRSPIYGKWLSKPH